MNANQALYHVSLTPKLAPMRQFRSNRRAGAGDRKFRNLTTVLMRGANGRPHAVLGETSGLGSSDFAVISRTVHSSASGRILGGLRDASRSNGGRTVGDEDVAPFASIPR